MKHSIKIQKSSVKCTEMYWNVLIVIENQLISTEQITLVGIEMWDAAMFSVKQNNL